MNKQRVSTVLFLFLVGLFVLTNILGQPRLAALHGSDIVRLMASGMCFGAAFPILFGYGKSRGE